MKLKVTAKYSISDVGGCVVANDGTVEVPDALGAELLRDRPEDFVQAGSLKGLIKD